MILVTGATGRVAGELVEQLLAKNQPVRALLRDEIVRGDLNEPTFLVDALNGGAAESEHLQETLRA